MSFLECQFDDEWIEFLTRILMHDVWCDGGKGKEILNFEKVHLTAAEEEHKTDEMN